MDLIVDIKSDLEKIPETVRPLVEKQLPFAISVALNRTVNTSIENVKIAMVKAFGTPKPYTLNSMYMKRARKNWLLAGLYFKDSKANQTPASSYLTRQVVGDSRPHKPNERKFTSIQKSDVGFGVTGGAFRAGGKDQYGNIPYGVYSRALTFLRQKNDAKEQAQKINLMKFIKEKFFGYKERRKRKKQSDYFIIPAGAKSHLKAGVWFKKNGRLSQILSLQEKRPNYKAILDFYGETFGRGEKIFAANFSWAMAQVLQQKLTESSYTNENQN